jgi:hypothetical protein
MCYTSERVVMKNMVGRHKHTANVGVRMTSTFTRFCLENTDMWSEKCNNNDNN